MDPAAIQGYITLIGLILHAGIQTEADLRIILGSHVTPADLDVILGQVTTRLARRGIPAALGGDTVYSPIVTR